MTTSQPIPIFESGYPLRVADLDNMFNYLDDGERHSRICLIGAGIFYGLEVKLAGTTITIKPGAGVTSQGFLYCNKAKRTFSKAKPISGDINTSTYSSAYLTNTLTWMEGDLAADMIKNPSNYSPYIFNKVVELVEDGIVLDPNSKVKDLLDSDLKDHTLVIVFERISEKRNGCTTCNKGTDGQVSVRFLLFQNTEWAAYQDKRKTELKAKDIICANQSATTAPTSLFPYLQRFGHVESSCVNNFNFTGSGTLNAAYKMVVDAAFIKLAAAFDSLLTQFTPILSENTEGDSTVIANWKTEVTKTPPSLIFNQNTYDYAKHLIQAYNELVEKPFVQNIGKLPDENCFPKYLILASFTTPQVQTEGISTPFYRPPFTETGAAFEEAKFLYKRLIALLELENTIWRKPTSPPIDRSVIKITPSRSAIAPLSNRAVPYYFEGAKMRPQWHFQLTKTKRTLSIPAYDREANAPFNEPFLYQNAFDNADFYRIEGHINQNLGVVWNRLVGDENSLRNCLNLPFSIEIVQLNRVNTQRKADFIELSEFAKLHTGLEHQGGVTRGGTLILVVEKLPNNNTGTVERDLTDDQIKVLSSYKVVADFCLPYWVVEKPRKLPAAIFKELRRELKPNTNTALKTWDVTFENKSLNSASFDWYIDGQIAVATGTIDNPKLTFSFDNPKEIQRTFVVTLVAKSKDDDLPSDMASQGVSITQSVFETPVADFELVGRVPFFESEVAGVRGIQLGETLTFENRSIHADRFTWSVSVPATLQTQANDKDKLIAQFRFSDAPYTIGLKAENSLDATLFAEAHMQIVVKVEKPVADFEFIKRETATNGESITFENRSNHATNYLWEVFLGTIKQTDLNQPLVVKGDFTYDFKFTQTAGSETKKFKVVLTATNAAGVTDSSEQEVVITRTVEKVEPPVADFELVKRVPHLDDKKNQQGETITFVNRSNHATDYEWQVFIGDVEQTDVNQPMTPKGNFTHNFKFIAGSATGTFRVVLTAKSPTATPNEDQAEQEVVVTEKLVAKFVIDTRSKNNLGEDVINFSNTSSNSAVKFTWLVDKVAVAPDRTVRDWQHPFSFPATDRTSTELDFIVTLIAFNAIGEQDVEELTVSIRRELPKPVVDFRFNPNRDMPLDIDGVPHVSVSSTIKDGFPAEFINLSDEAPKYQWSVFLNGNLAVGNSRTMPTNKSVKFSYPFAVVQGKPTTYEIQIIAYDAANKEVGSSIKRLTVTPLPGGPPPNALLATEAIALIRDLDRQTANTPTVDGLTASRNMEARRRDFRKGIEDEGSDHPPLSKKASFRNVVDFMDEMDKVVADFDRVSSLQKGFERLDEFDKTFKTNVLQLVQNIKKAGGVPDDAYRKVLRNLLFFYLDKLVHLLPEKLTATTERTIGDVLAKVKAEQSFGTDTLDDLRKAWQVADITTMQNVPVAEQLNGLFG